MKKITLKDVKELLDGKVNRIELGSGTYMEALDYDSFTDKGVYTNRGFSCCVGDYIDKKCRGSLSVYFEDEDCGKKALQYIVDSFNNR